MFQKSNNRQIIGGKCPEWMYDKMTMCNISSSKIFMTTYNLRPASIIFCIIYSWHGVHSCLLHCRCWLILHLILMIVGGVGLETFNNVVSISLWYLISYVDEKWYRFLCFNSAFSFTILLRWKYKMFCWQAPGGSCNNFHVSLWYIFSQKIRIRRQGAGNTFQFSGDYWFLVQFKYIGQGRGERVPGHGVVGVCICICLISLIYCWSQ